MKALKLIIFISCCFSGINTLAQTPKGIEAALLKSFKKIDYWADKGRRDITGNISLDDSLENANEVFAKKLKDYTVKYPTTISQDFSALKKERLDIFTSADGLLRVYSWETWLGGTMRDFANVFQYNTGKNIQSVYLHSTGDDSKENVPFYSNLYTFKANQKTYYLGIYGCIYSTKDAGTGIKIFDIENGGLNTDVKIIKTASGLHGKIYYDYDFFSVVDITYGKRPTISFDATTKSIYVPLVDGNGKVTHKFITYKFTGKYFEKVTP